MNYLAADFCQKVTINGNAITQESPSKSFGPLTYPARPRLTFYVAIEFTPQDTETEYLVELRFCDHAGNVLDALIGDNPIRRPDVGQPDIVTVPIYLLDHIVLNHPDTYQVQVLFNGNFQRSYQIKLH